MATDVVGFACFAFVQYKPKGVCMVLDIEPIADVFAIAIDRNWFFVEEALDDNGDEFFWELVRAIVIGAVGDDGVHAVGVVVGTDHHVAGGFAGRVGGVGGIRGCFCEESCGSQGAVDFVRGDVIEAMGSEVIFPLLVAGF